MPVILQFINIKRAGLEGTFCQVVFHMMGCLCEQIIFVEMRDIERRKGSGRSVIVILISLAIILPFGILQSLQKIKKQNTSVELCAYFPRLVLNSDEAFQSYALQP